MAQNHYNALDNGVQPWLPQGHARISHDYIRAKDQYSGFEAQYGIKSPYAETNSPVMFEGQARAGQGIEGGTTGPGMQAIFLGPKNISCGTGVFIPLVQGNHLRFTRKKPAFSPVLLPSRVIQALNLNVHKINQHTKPQTAEEKKNPVVEKIDEKLEKKEEMIDEKLEKKEEKIADDDEIPPEFFLPEEWTY